MLDSNRFTVLGPLMGGKGSQAFLGVFVEEEGKRQTRPVVLVFLPEELSANEDILRQVIDETEVASEIDHINTIGVWGVVELDEGFARVVEFADAENLQTVLDRLAELGRSMPWKIAAAIAANACMGVHYAHELGSMESGKPLLHGGIRPATLLVCFQGFAKVTGYGAGVLAEWIRRSRGEEAVVRDPYIAPEQIFGGRSAADVHTDVYALGAVLYRSLTGRAPIDENADLGDALIREDIRPEQLLGVEPKLAEIVLRAMRRKASERFASAMDMRQALLETGMLATESEVRAFMEEIFPIDYPTRVARMNLLSAARKKREVTQPRFIRPRTGASTEGAPVVDESAPPKQSSLVADPPEADGSPEADDAAPPPSHLAAPTTPPTPSMPPVTVPPTPAVAPSPPTSSTPAQPVAQPPAPSGQASAPAYSAPPAAMPTGGLAWEQPPPPTAPTVKMPTAVVVILGLVATAALGLAAVLAVLLLKNDPPPPVVVAAPPTPPPAPVEPPPPPPPPPEPEKPAQPEPDPEPKKPARPTNGKVTITTLAGVDIILNGDNIGTGTGTAELKAGTYKVKLVDKSRGISLNRKVRVKGGDHTKVEFDIGKGWLVLDAPPGATVIIDGKKKGTTPLGRIELIEGSHDVLVTNGQAKYKRSFTLRSGDEATMWVEFRTTETPQ